MVPAILLRIHSWLEVGRSAGGAAAAARSQFEPILLQHVERLLDEGVLQEESGRVPVRQSVVGISGLVQRFPKHISTQRHLAAYQNSRQLAELNICEAITAKSKATSVTDSDASFLAIRRTRIRFLDGVLETRQPVMFGFSRESLVFPEALGQHQPAVTKVVKHVSEEDAVAVEEEAAAGVARMFGVGDGLRG